MEMMPCVRCGSTRRGAPRERNPYGECLDCEAIRTAAWYAKYSGPYNIARRLRNTYGIEIYD